MQAYAVAQAAALQQAPFPEHLQAQRRPQKGLRPLQRPGQPPQQRQIVRFQPVGGHRVLQGPPQAHALVPGGQQAHGVPGTQFVPPQARG